MWTIVKREEDDGANEISRLLSREEILESLKFLEIHWRRDNIRPAYGKTCQWLLKHPDDVSWLNPDKFDDHKGFLWIKGGFGSGKSTLMKFAYENTLKQYADGHTAFVGFFFNAMGDKLRNQQKACTVFDSSVDATVSRPPGRIRSIKPLALPYKSKRGLGPEPSPRYFL
ncbi:pfs, nb-arc and ankyrin domain [Trichoderma arundinaceum]|uniref:Pfs, nb-arc and ankyrin domain n=1 Tax=Trichoderma arundinaceum TaxID=490622 RepID=A0A395NHR0_TRIAR|nr:pfs, nb-arc and ankyrin domain [Trichoderma arundinaceum]